MKITETELITLISEAVRSVMQEVIGEKRMLMEMARVGILDNKYDVLVYTDDMGLIPHIHIIDKGTNGQEFNCCVQLETNKYFQHGIHQDVLNSKGRKLLNDFMRQPCRNPKFKNNYEFAVDMWNANNSSTYVQIREDSQGNIIMPDYTEIEPYK